TKKTQGVWVQSSDSLLANHQGTVPLPAASITKVATSLVALSTFGPNHRFVTTVSTTGSIENGTLEGDLVVQGNQDPLFIWEEAFALGNLLNQLGIKRVKGNLIISGKFYMNYEYDPLKSGNLLKVGMNSQLWTPQALNQYQSLPPGTPRPKVIIDGAVKVLSTPPSNAKSLVRHYSPTLADLLKKMNRYSNNKMSEIIADSVGGAKQVAKKAAITAGVPQTEIQLVNGSGLSELNKISPRAAVALFLAIDRYLQPLNMSIGDVLTVVGQDKSILDERKIPQLSVVKSGSLNNVSALAGALPTKDKGIVWFAIMNGGTNLTGFRTQQELLLNNLVSQWGVVDSLPSELTPTQNPQDQISRNEVVKE
ncbi:MAG TPA: D-alanyl-D-alanine carboxypeptidase, partial [Phormidium sp.]